MNKKKKPDKEVLGTLYYTYNETQSGGEICAGQEDDSWPNHELLEIDWDLISVQISQPKHTYSWEDKEVSFIPKEGIDVYVVVVKYGSGGTFGQSSGNGYVEGIYQSPDEAMDVKQLIQQDQYSGYAPWSGYFESLESVDIERITVKS